MILFCLGKTFLENLIDEAVEALIQNISTGPMKVRNFADIVCVCVDMLEKERGEGEIDDR